MKKLSLLAIALWALVPTGSAMATEMPTAKPEADASVYAWTGCYVGMNAGGAAGGSNFATRSSPGTHLSDLADLAAVGTAGNGSANESVFIGGGQAGCNWQTPKLVFGLEGDLDYFSTGPSFTANGVLVTGDVFRITNSAKTDWLATIRPRAGIAAGRSLLYVTGGVAVAEFSHMQAYADTLFAAVGHSSASGNVVGWTLGAGWETAWTAHWTLKFEYLFAKFSSTAATGDIVSTAGGTNVLHGSADLAVQIARAGLSYKF